MKRTHLRILTLCIALLLTSGCAMHYDITLYNGRMIRANSKPKLNERGEWVFKDGLGRENAVNALRVRKIEAVTPGDPPSREFN